MNAIPSNTRGDAGKGAESFLPRQASVAAPSTSARSPGSFISASAAPAHSQGADPPARGTSTESPSVRHHPSVSQEATNGGALSSTPAHGERCEPVLETDRTSSAAPIAAARPYQRRQRLPSAISEAELFRGLENAAPWTSEAR